MRRRWARRALTVSGLASVLTLLSRPLARAGSDVFQNIGPASPLGSAASFARYPLSHYALDQHFTVVAASLTGGVNVDGLVPEIAWFFASLAWLGTSFLAKVVIELFAFAFSLDLVNGSSATGGAGGLGPVSQAIHSIYANVFGAPWLVLAFSAVGMWAMWKALVQRRYSETAGALALSLIYIVIALFFVAEPGQTIGQASRWTNEMSQTFLSISDHGTPSGGEAATADGADQLWGLLVEKPWSVLEFGGLEHCAIDGTGDENSDPQSAPVRPLSRDAGQDASLAHRLASGTEVAAEGKTCINNANKYSSHFLRFGIGTDERNEEYDALDHGDSSKLPEADSEKAGYKLGVADKPATDAMEEGGQYQRLAIAGFVLVGELGAFTLLGALAIGVILSQVLLLLLLAFSPVALVAAAIPGRGHDFFKAWLEKLGGYLLRKAAYSLVLAVLLAVNGAIADATWQLGWLFSFGLQAAFFWAVLIQRRTLTSGIIGIATGSKTPGHDLAVDAVALYAGARLGALPFRGAGRVGGAALSLFRVGGEAHDSRRRPSFGGASHSVAVGAGGLAASGASDSASEGAGLPAISASDHGSAAGAERREPPKGAGTETKFGTPAPEGVADASADRESKAAGTDREPAARQKKGASTPADGSAPETAKGRKDEQATGGSGRSGENGESPSRRRPGGPLQPAGSGDEDPRGSDRAPEDVDVHDAKPARRRQGTAGSKPEGEPAEASQPERRSKPNPGQRPAGRQGSDRREPGGRGEAGGTGAPPQRSDLSDELRAEREVTKRPAPPSAPASEKPSEAPDQLTSDRPARIPGRAEQPSSPPRRRRRRLWRRHK